MIAGVLAILLLAPTAAEYDARLAALERALRAQRLAEAVEEGAALDDPWLNAIVGDLMVQAPPDFEGARRRLAFAQREVAHALTVGPPRGPSPGDVARAILAERSSRERAAAEDVPAEAGSWLASLWQRVKNWWANLWAAGSAPGPVALWFQSVFRAIGRVLAGIPWSAIGLLVLLGLAALVFRRAARSLRAPTVPVGYGAPPGSLVGDALRHDAALSLAEGRAHLDRGDIREAVRAFYVGILSALHRSRVLELDAALTNWEHLDKLKSRPDLRDRLVPSTRTFDLVWYGRRPVERAEASAIEALLVELAQP